MTKAGTLGALAITYGAVVGIVWATSGISASYAFAAAVLGALAFIAGWWQRDLWK